ncbi:flavodoxin family protein [Hymenobacter rubidus]|uniref:flavodoxin family protein n=1 Tax=Hymenobacter rubidus TaxID=1441626 RepID=UPI00191EF585|nr:NAD(P)H-dependent oxidoreductase [Hymenobacter rubidus]
MKPQARRFLFLLSSTRRLGNSEQLAYCAAHGLPPTIEQHWVHLQDYPLPHFVDMRHNGAYPAPTGNVQLLLDATLAATDIVLIAPLYMFSLPVHAKHYLDYWSAWLRIPALNFREQMQAKTLWAVVVSSGSRAETQPLEATLLLTAQFMHMQWGGLLHGIGSRPNDIQLDTLALREAKTFFLAPKATSLAAALPLPGEAQAARLP